MVAASANALTGEIIATLYWSESGAIGFSNWTYTGSISGHFFSDLDFIDAIAASQNGMSTKDFRGLASGIRNELRNAVRSIHGMGSLTKFPLDPWLSYARGSTWAKRVEDYRKTRTNFNSDLISGFVPEGFNVALLDKLANWFAKENWSRTKTIEHVKTIRRERDKSFDAVAQRLLDYVKASHTAKQTVVWGIKSA